MRLRLAVAVLLVASLFGVGLEHVLSTGALLAALLLLLAWERVPGPAAMLDALWRRRFGIALGTLGALALAVRLAGIGLGLGHEGTDIDEARLGQSVREFFQTGAQGHFTTEDHPGLHFWLLAGGALAAYLWSLMSGALRNVDQASVELFVWAGRSTNAVLGAATAVLTGLLGRAVAGPGAGLAAALLVSVVPLSVETSTQLRNDVGLGFFVVACAWAAERARARPSATSIALAGILAGCATGTKYTGVFTLLPVLLAASLPGRERRAWRHAALGLAAFACAVAATNHFVWWDFPNFVRQLSMDFGHVKPDHFAATPEPRWAYVSLLAEYGVGWPLLLLSAAAAAAGLANGAARAWVLAAFPIAYLWFMTHKPALFPRWAYPLVPFVAIGAGAGLVAVSRRLALRGGRLAAGFVVAGLAVPALWPAAASISRRFTPPTYALAETWLADEVAGGERVLTAPGMLPGMPGAARGLGKTSGLKDLLDAERYELYRYDWIVVPERLFTHPALAPLTLTRTFTIDTDFGGNRGADVRVYKPPTSGLVVDRIELSTPGSSPFLGFGWGREPRPDGRVLPREGAALYLPPLAPGARLEVELASPYPAPVLRVSVEGVEIATTVAERTGSRVRLLSEPLPERVRKRLRPTRFATIRLQPEAAVPIASVAIR